MNNARLQNDKSLIVFKFGFHRSDADTTVNFNVLTPDSTPDELTEKLDFSLKCFAFVIHGWTDYWPGKGQCGDAG